jgi:uncharacterized protein YkwD
MPMPPVVRRRRALRVSVGVLATIMVAAIAVRVYLTRTVVRSPEEMAGISEPETEILRLVNLERTRRGRKPLQFAPRLAVVARGHSYDMAIRHYRNHDTPEGGTPADRVRGVGIPFRSVAENIYVDNFRTLEGVADRAVKGWLASADHRANLLSDDFTSTGIGIARSMDGYTYVTQDLVR